MATGKFVPLTLTALFLSGCQSWTMRGVDSLPPTAALPESSEAGWAELRYFDGVSGNSLAQLTSLSRYPDNPDQVLELTRLSVSPNRADNYGSLVRGFIEAPASGLYKFYVSGDDETQFLLSPSQNASDARVIASVTGWTSARDYSKYSSQVSAVQELTAGKRYYFELRHKEGGGGDHFSVAWEGPGFGRSVIDSQYLYSPRQESQLYPDTADARRGFSAGYRVGFFDGEHNLPFNDAYPPLDEDQDGLYDNWEVQAGLNPADPEDANADPDNDLLTTADEYQLWIDPTSADTDGDSIPDGAEFAYGLDPADPLDAERDADGDGYSNLREYNEGTDPSNPDDKPVEPEAPVDVPYTQGLVGQYFSGRNFETFDFARLDESPTNSWGGGSPGGNLPNDRFSVRWYSTLVPAFDSGQRNYEFRISRDDGARLYVGGDLIIDAWTGMNSTTYRGQKVLLSGESYPVTVEYNEGYGGASITLQVVDLSSGQTLTPSDIFRVTPLDSSISADTDGDSIPDTWEMKYGSDPWEDDSNQVLNNEGLSVLEAFNSGVSPRAPDQPAAWEGAIVSSDDSTTSEPSAPEPEPEPTPSPIVTLSWTAPGTRIDGSSIALSEIASYRINYGQSETNPENVVTVPSEQTSFEFKDLGSGVWYFYLRTVDQNGLLSPPSNTVQYRIQ
ncbi:hypothetical protein A6779_09075 [Marinobacter adhaerens]|nr:MULTISPECIES: PA14 domain-containing protein [Marinobacter]ODM32271.1 hypothetical protein A6779_09075 [Marinobacter adhaerens]